MCSDVCMWTRVYSTVYHYTNLTLVRDVRAGGHGKGI